MAGWTILILDPGERRAAARQTLERKLSTAARAVIRLKTQNAIDSGTKAVPFVAMPLQTFNIDVYRRMTALHCA